MSLSHLSDNKTVKFYSNPLLYSPKKKIITDKATNAYQEGRNACMNGITVTENPYNQDDTEAIFTAYDVWNEGYLSIMEGR